MNKADLNFKDKTIKQIKIWAWLASVLPITALAGVFFAWAFFDATFFGYVMVYGQIIMFAIAVVWWWWAMYTMRNLIKYWDETKDKVADVLLNIRDIKVIVNEAIKKDKEDK